MAVRTAPCAASFLGSIVDNIPQQVDRLSAYRTRNRAGKRVGAFRHERVLGCLCRAPRSAVYAVALRMARAMRHARLMPRTPSLLRHTVLLTALFATPAPPPCAFAIRDARAQAEEGWATFYAKRRAGRRTASGERYDPSALVAAHPTLPLGAQVRVTRL